MTVFHVSKATSKPLKEVLGGDEARFMTPAVASNLPVLDAVVSCWFDLESAETEVSLFNRSLDILASAEIPGTGEETLVAIENQYGTADPDHFGRLVGWYMPETNAEMGILIAESFEPHLLNAVDRGLIIRPRLGLWLIEASGQIVNGVPLVQYVLRATSLDRDVLIAREKAYRLNLPGASADSAKKTSQDVAATEALFEHIGATGSGSLSAEVRRQKSVSKWYRKVQENSHGCHLAVFIGSNRVSIGSVYSKGSLQAATLDKLTELNNNIELQPDPTKRELRSLWWNISDIGRSTPRESWPQDLGMQLDKKFDELLPTLQEHQARLQQVIEHDSRGLGQTP
jgi:hypothetical protein